MGAPRKSRCKHGHAFIESNIFIDSRGRRGCRECRRRNTREAGRRKYQPRPRPDPVIATDPMALAYAAGIIDGEGSMSIVPNRKQAGKAVRWHKLVVSVTNTDPRLTAWMQAHFGGTVGISHKGKERQAPATNWRVNGRWADAFLHAVYPYLVIKADQADVAFLFRKTVGKGRAAPVTDALFAYRESLRAELRRLQTYRRLAPIRGPE